MTTHTIVRVGAAAAAAVVRAALTEAGVSAADAADVATALTETSLRGVDTHGLRLLPQYLDELARGVAVARPTIRTARGRGAGVLLDAGGALGIVAGLAAVRQAARGARRYGVAAVGVRNSNHFGAAGVYSRWLARRGMVGIVTTSAASRVAPYGGVHPLFGTNPISVAAGTGGTEFALDMATSQVSFGRIKEQGRTGGRLEPGWATDPAGRPATDPEVAYALSPVGGYKGHGLAMVATLLGALLTGAPPDWRLHHVGQSPDGSGRQVGHLVVCLDPEAFVGADAFTAGVEDLLDTVRTAPAANGEPVLAPGDPERATAAERGRDGIPLDGPTATTFTDLAARHGIDLEM